MNLETLLRHYLKSHSTGLLFLAYNMRVEYRPRVASEALSALAEAVLCHVLGHAPDLSGATPDHNTRHIEIRDELASCPKKEYLRIKVQTDGQNSPEMIGAVSLYLKPRPNTQMLRVGVAQALTAIYNRKEAANQNDGLAFDATTRSGDAYISRMAKFNALRDRDEVRGYHGRPMLVQAQKTHGAKAASPTNRLNAQDTQITAMQSRLDTQAEQITAMRALLKDIAVHTGLLQA